MAGFAESGDGYLVEPFSNGVLVAVVDGLGHGPSAATAAQTAIAALEGHAHESAVTLLKRCHEKLRRTRGVAMNLASFDATTNSMTWVGIGNVTGLLLRASKEQNPSTQKLTLRGGIVGYQLPTPRPTTVSISKGDTLVFATDGLKSRFAKDLTPDEPPHDMAERILTEHTRGRDDALVLVARYIGAPSLALEGPTSLEEG
jgi:serine phosphatase RsbU (regulator of sigma subunit)